MPFIFSIFLGDWSGGSCRNIVVSVFSGGIYVLHQGDSSKKING